MPQRRTTTPQIETLRKSQAKKRASADPVHILDRSIYHLWETINDLDQIQPERVEHYRVSIFGRRPGHACRALSLLQLAERGPLLRPRAAAVAARHRTAAAGPGDHARGGANFPLRLLAHDRDRDA